MMTQSLHNSQNSRKFFPRTGTASPRLLLFFIFLSLKKSCKLSAHSSKIIILRKNSLRIIHNNQTGSGSHFTSVLCMRAHEIEEVSCALGQIRENFVPFATLLSFLLPSSGEKFSSSSQVFFVGHSSDLLNGRLR